MDRADREFDEFVRSRTPALLRLAYLLTGDQHLADDLVQGALARTHQAWHRLRAVDNPLTNQAVPSVCGHINVNTGAFTPVADGCGTIAFAASGGLWARYPEVRNAQGDLVAQLPAAPVPVPRVVVQAISADGRLVAMGAGSTDPGVSRTVQWILDTATNEFLTVDVLLGPDVVPAGAELHGAVFLPDGGLVLGVTGPGGDRSWYLLDADRSVVAAHYNAPFWVSPGQFVHLP